MTRRTLAAVALVSAALGTAGCGEDGKVVAPASPGAAADRTFVAEMTEHHEGAIAMAAIASERAEHREIRDLAEAITATQEAEIDAMREIVEGGGHGGHGAAAAGAAEDDAHAGGSGDGHAMGPEAAALRDAKPFDRAFIDAMIPHHEDAVEMSLRLLKEGRNRELQAVAGTIIEGQRREIAQMRDWRKAWYGS